MVSHDSAAAQIKSIMPVQFSTDRHRATGVTFWTDANLVCDGYEICRALQLSGWFQVRIFLYVWSGRKKFLTGVGRGDTGSNISRLFNPQTIFFHFSSFSKNNNINFRHLVHYFCNQEKKNDYNYLILIIFIVDTSRPILILFKFETLFTFLSVFEKNVRFSSYIESSFQ